MGSFIDANLEFPLLGFASYFVFSVKKTDANINK
jgi:hypothetical protein